MTNFVFTFGHNADAARRADAKRGDRKHADCKYRNRVD